MAQWKRAKHITLRSVDQLPRSATDTQNIFASILQQANGIRFSIIASLKVTSPIFKSENNNNEYYNYEYYNYV